MSAIAEEADPAALLVAAIQNAAAAAQAAGAAAEAARDAALQTQTQLDRSVPGLATKIDALVHDLQVMTPRREALRRARAARYFWAAGGFLVGLLFGLSIFLLAVAPHLPG